MEFDEKVYEQIMSEILEKKLVLEDGYDGGDVMSSSRIKLSPDSSYYLFRESYPELNDYYDMKYDVHVVYYAIMHYHNIECKKLYESQGKVFEMDVVKDVEALVESLHDMERKYSVRKIEQMKKRCKNNK